MLRKKIRVCKLSVELFSPSFQWDFSLQFLVNFGDYDILKRAVRKLNVITSGGGGVGAPRFCPDFAAPLGPLRNAQGR